MYAMPQSNLAADQYIGKKPPRGLRRGRPDTFPPSTGRRARAQKGNRYIITLPRQANLLDLTYVKAASFHLLFYITATCKLAKRGVLE
jgi:hypothetical protein